MSPFPRARPAPCCNLSGTALLRGFPGVQPQHVVLAPVPVQPPEKKKIGKKKSLALTDLLGKAEYLQGGSSWLGSPALCSPLQGPACRPLAQHPGGIALQKVALICSHRRAGLVE